MPGPSLEVRWACSQIHRALIVAAKLRSFISAGNAPELGWGQMLEADSHLALMGPVITYKTHGRVYCPWNQQVGSRGSARLANRAERLPRGGCRGSA